MDPSVSTTAEPVLLLFIAFGFLVIAKVRAVTATLILMFASTLFLPVGAGFDLPGMPPLGKRSLPYIILAIGVLVMWTKRIKGIGLGKGLDMVVVAIVVSPIITAVLNPDSFNVGSRFLPGLKLWDGVAQGGQGLVDIGFPYLIGRVIFKTSEDMRRLIVWLAGAGLIYSLLAILEIRLSPQLHNWIYGYYPNEFRFNYRWGSYRPMIFLPGGIAVGLFMASTTLAAFALRRVKARIFVVPSQIAGPYLFLVLVACKSLAAILYGFILVPVISFFAPRTIRRVALGIVVLVMVYPLLRAQDAFPTQALVSWSSAISQSRSESLATRFYNEDILLEKASSRMLFGWGAYARGRIFDPRTGRDITRSDGYWMILISKGGLVMWACYFLLLLSPIILAGKRLERLGREDRILMAGLLLIIALYALDELLNGFYTNLMFALSGGAVTLLRLIPAEKEPDSAPVFDPRRLAKTRGESPSASLSGGLLDSGSR